VVGQPDPLQQSDPGQQFETQRQGWHTIQLTHFGQLQHEGGGGGGGGAGELQQPPLQQVGAQGRGHAHQIEHLLHEQPEQHVLSQEELVVVASVVVVVVVGCTTDPSPSPFPSPFPLSQHGQPLHGLHMP
jgi:hypothetical protein